MKRGILLTIALFASLKVFAEKSFSIGPYFSIREGTLYEYLYSLGNDNKEVSLLEWDYSPLYCAGISGDFTEGRFALHSKIDYAIPGRCGTMYDSDFFYANGIKDTCNYSWSENSCRKNINAEIGADYEYSICDFFSLRPAFYFQYSYSNFKAENGRGRYGRAPYSKTGTDVNWQNKNAKEVKLRGCEYKRHNFSSWVGIESVFALRRNFTAGFGVFASPYTYTYFVDHHLNKPTLDTYLDMATGSSFSKWKYRFFTSASLSARVTLNAAIEYMTGSTDKNKSRYADYTGIYHQISQKTGSNAKQLDFSIGLKIAL